MDNCTSFDALILWMEGKLVVSSFTENGECSAEFESSQKFHERSVENTRLRLVFSTSLKCSQMSVVFYHSVIHVLGFFICFKI